jgi:hypothetical protein
MTFSDFRETNVSIKTVDFISVLWKRQGDRPCPFLINPVLLKRLYWTDSRFLH